MIPPLTKSKMISVDRNVYTAKELMNSSCTQSRKDGARYNVAGGGAPLGQPCGLVQSGWDPLLLVTVSCALDPADEDEDVEANELVDEPRVLADGVLDEEAIADRGRG